MCVRLLPCCCVQYALDYYPPFASGCGFILSRDLVQALLKQPLPDYRLLVGSTRRAAAVTVSAAPASADLLVCTHDTQQVVSSTLRV